MPAYAIFMVTKEHDHELLLEYRKLAHPSLKQYGARPRVVGSTRNVAIEGNLVKYIVMMEFDSLEAAQRWYDSPEYAPARSLRKRACDCEVIFTESLA
jgi:uncharacterized protein (DUF1330 family)